MIIRMMHFVLPCLIAGVISQNSFAYSYHYNDWCGGKKWWLMDMSLTERSQQAVDSLQKTADRLKKEALRLESSAKQHSADLREHLSQQQKTLSKQTITLCQQAKTSGFPLQYQSVELKSNQDYRIQLQLNLDLIAAQQQMVGALEQEESRFATHIQQLKIKQNKLRLLSQQATVKDSPVSATQFIRQACQAQQESENALEATQKIILSERLEQRLADLKKSSISVAWLDQFIQSCEIQPIQPQRQKESDWWKHLLTDNNADDDKSVE